MVAPSAVLARFGADLSILKNKNGSPGGSRTRDFLDENQASWTTRRRDLLLLL